MSDAKRCDNPRCKRIFPPGLRGSFMLVMGDDPMITTMEFPVQPERDLCSIQCVIQVAELLVDIHGVA